MSNSVTLTFRLTEQHWRQFYEVHYAADHRLKIRYIYGGACILIGAMGLGGMFNKYLSAAVLLSGFYGVLSRHIFLFWSIAACRKHPLYDKNVVAEVSREGITVSSEDREAMQPWENFTGYRNAEPGIMFYMAPNAFFFVPKTAYSTDDAAAMVSFAESAGLRKLA